MRLSFRRLSVPVWSLSSRYLPSALRYIAFCEGIVTGGTTLPLQERSKISDDGAYHAGNVLGFGRSRSATPDHGQTFRQGQPDHSPRGLTRRLRRWWSTDGASAQPATVSNAMMTAARRCLMDCHRCTAPQNYTSTAIIPCGYIMHHRLWWVDSSRSAVCPAGAVLALLLHASRRHEL
jgi:hypothetical protein